jgi:aquaporin Z
MHKTLTEFIGTYFLVLTVCLSMAGSSILAPFAIGASLMIMVYMGGPISGGHYNPAVSLAALLSRKLPASDFIPYLIAQVLGSIAAAWSAWRIVGRAFAPAPTQNTTALAAVAVEFLFTFALALVVLNTATSKRSQGNSYFGLAIGSTIAVAAFAGGGISGGAFNPAVGTGTTLVSALVAHGTLGHLWLYLVGPFLGGAVAAGVFGFQEAGA